MALDRNHPTAAIPATRASMPSASRLRLRPTPAARGVLDGGWWPRSRDPAVELPKLIADLNTRLGQGASVTCVALNLTAWDRTPHRIAIGDRIVPVGWFQALDVDTIADADTIAVTTTRGDRITLLVVPPETTAASAAIALAMAASGDDSVHPLAILAASGITARDSLAASLARHPSFSSAPSPTTPHGETRLHPVP
jgi:Family of unknown function (DUF5994)